MQIEVRGETISPPATTVHFSPKERIIRLVEAIALTALTIGIALFFETVRNLWKESWTGKKVTPLTGSQLKPPPTPIRAKPLTFSEIEKKTETLTFNYLNTAEVRHRFTNILCPEETAVLVDTIPLHANRIAMPDNRTYIATQAPLLTERERFWKMAFENNGCVVDITTLNDRTTGGVRGYSPYTPNQPEQYGDLTVTLKERNKVSSEFYISSYQVEINGEKKTVERLHFLGWKDFHGAGLEALQLVIDRIEPHLKQGLTPIIHCRAGVGRTGTLITILTLIELFRQGSLTKHNLESVVEEVIMKGRECRGPGFVQTKNQFDTIMDYATTLL